jgi:hypothetical protein
MYINLKKNLQVLISCVHATSNVRRYGSIAGFALMSTLFVFPLPVLGQSSSIASTVNQDSPLLIANGLWNFRRDRSLRQRKTPIRRPSPSPVRTRPAAEQPPEDPYVSTLSPEERRVYEIVQNTKRDLRHQPFANLLGSGMGISPKAVVQSPADLDRDFQAAIQEFRNSNPVKPAVSNPLGNPVNNPDLTVPTTDITAIEAAPKKTADPKTVNQMLQRLLGKRSNETHDKWYARTNLFMRHLTLEEQKAWRASLLPSDAKTYDAIAKAENRQRMEEVGGAVSEMIRRDLSCRWVDDPSGSPYAPKIQVCND